MAMFHCHISVGKRSAGRSACAASAYRAADNVRDEETQLVHDFSRKSGVVYSEIMLCENAPEEYKDRETLWNSVQKAERSKNAQLFREVEVALPTELTREQQIDLVRDYVRENFVSKGMCADWSLHDKDDGNPHAHIMLTMRGIDKDGKWEQKRRTEYAKDENGDRIPVLDKKGNQKHAKNGQALFERIDVPTNDWNDQARAEQWRESWAQKCNERLPKQSHIDHRSYERQGVDKIAQIHEGYAARQMERRGKMSERCELNREIRALNEARRIVGEKAKALEAEAKRVLKQPDKNAESLAKMQRQIDAIRRRKAAEKRAANKADAKKTGAEISGMKNRIAEIKESRDCMKQAKEILDVKQLAKMSNPAAAIKKGFDLVSKAANLGNSEAQSFLQNNGGTPEHCTANWEWLTEMEKDEIRAKNQYGEDDYGDDGKSLMSGYKPKVIELEPEPPSFSR